MLVELLVETRAECWDLKTVAGLADGWAEMRVDEWDFSTVGDLVAK